VLCTDRPSSAKLSGWHNVREKTFQTHTLLNTVKSTVASSNTSDIATMVMEKRQRPNSGD